MPLHPIIAPSPTGPHHQLPPCNKLAPQPTGQHPYHPHHRRRHSHAHRFNAPASEVRVGNLEELVAYGFYYRTMWVNP